MAEYDLQVRQNIQDARQGGYQQSPPQYPSSFGANRQSYGQQPSKINSVPAFNERTIQCNPSQVTSADNSVWARNARLQVNQNAAGTIYGTIYFDSGAVAKECAPHGNDAPWLMVRLLQGGRPVTDWLNTTPASVLNARDPSQHQGPVNAAVSWDRVDSCEVDMPGQAHCR